MRRQPETSGTTDLEASSYRTDGPPPRGSRRGTGLTLAILLVSLSILACIASAPPAGDDASDPEQRRSPAPDEIVICVRNDARLPATVQLFRDGSAVGSPVHVTGFARSCRSMHRGEMLGTLDVAVDPVGPPGRYFPESLRDILVTTESRGIDVTLSREGVHPYSQSTYRVRGR